MKGQIINPTRSKKLLVSCQYEKNEIIDSIGYQEPTAWKTTCIARYKISTMMKSTTHSRILRPGSEIHLALNLPYAAFSA